MFSKKSCFLFSNIPLSIVLITEARKKMDVIRLINYLNGTLDKSQSDEVEHWINETTENRKKVELLYLLDFLDNRKKAYSDIDVDAQYEKFAQLHLPHSVQSKSIKRFSATVILRVAAVAIILLTSVLFATLFLIDETADPIKIATQLGERSQITLPDGTNVWLNAFSNLEYKKSFLSRRRNVTLTGEAYFEVANNKKLPFIVNHSDTKIKVLGTKFNVRANADEKFSSTTLLDGSVEFSVNNANISTLLVPGKELIYNKETHQFNIKAIEFPEDNISWKNGILLFENASLAEISKSLERNFNVNIIFADEKLKKERFTAEFRTSDNIYQILSALELTKKFKLNIDNRNITLLPIK